MQYRSEIDGLRAIAVLPVILFHAGFSWFSGGYVGVDVFFVISGYLITSILIDDLEKNRFSLATFYERRARRIIPALALVVFTSTIFAWLMLNPIEFKRYGNALLGVATFTSNIIFWKSAGYFDESSELSPLLHTWSLAVEEQYYVFFPIFLALAWRFGRNRAFFLIIVISVLSLALSEWGARNSPNANFYLAPTRAWELLAGSLAAFVLKRRGVLNSNILSALGLSLVVFSIFFFDEKTPFPSIYSLAPVLGVFLIVVYGSKETITAKALSSKVLVSIGLISYSAYLWHQPVFAFSRKYLDVIDLPVNIALGLSMLSLSLAYFSWKFVENPFRNKKVFSAKFVFGASSIALTSILGVGLLHRFAIGEIEPRIAYELTKSDYVYFSNVDERKFIESRLKLQLPSAETVIMGSSRMMQVDPDVIDGSAINLSVSGASLQDDVAFIGESVAQLNPSRVLIGADPWLLNKFHGKTAWKSIDNLYGYWQSNIVREKAGISEPFFKSSDRYEPDSNFILNLYMRLNVSGALSSENGNHELTAKKSSSGLHIYDLDYISKPYSEIEGDFRRLLDYAMKKYQKDPSLEQRLKQLVSWLESEDVDVYFVLSPYHPSLYALMKSEKPKFLAIEAEFQRISESLGVEIIGSYDPEKAGCVKSEFYDGMHPKMSCMSRIVRSVPEG